VSGCEWVNKSQGVVITHMLHYLFDFPRIDNKHNVVNSNTRLSNVRRQNLTNITSQLTTSQHSLTLYNTSVQWQLQATAN